MEQRGSLKNKIKRFVRGNNEQKKKLDKTDLHPFIGILPK